MFTVLQTYLPYAFITAITPGPNNIVALHAVSQTGWKRGQRTLLGMLLGFWTVMMLCALLCYQLNRYLPAVTSVLKYVGAAYILWLAVHVFRSKPDDAESHAVSFGKGFLLQFVNVKIILYAITIYTGYVLPNEASLPSLLLHSVYLTLLGGACMLVWALAGGFLRTLLQRYYRIVNTVMAAVLIYCAITLLW